MSNEEIGGYFAIGYTAVSQTALRLRRQMKENRRLKQGLYRILK